MVLRFVLDENLRGPLFRAVRHHNLTRVNKIDVVAVGDLPDLPLSIGDEDLLAWAEKEQRLIVSLDKRTFPDHLAEHLAAGHHSPGVLLLSRSQSLREIVEGLEAIAHASFASEWEDRVHYL